MNDIDALLAGVSFPANEAERLIVADFYEEQGNDTDADACRNPPVPEIFFGIIGRDYLQTNNIFDDYGFNGDGVGGYGSGTAGGYGDGVGGYGSGYGCGDGSGYGSGYGYGDGYGIGGE